MDDHAPVTDPCKITMTRPDRTMVRVDREKMLAQIKPGDTVLGTPYGGRDRVKMVYAHTEDGMLHGVQDVDDGWTLIPIKAVDEVWLRHWTEGIQPA